MPIPARLSHTLHQKLGDQAGNDLVDWMQTVDEHRAELRDLNELNAARVDSRLDLHAAAFDSRLDLHAAAFDSRLNEVRHELRAEIAELRQEVRVGFTDVRAGLESKIDRRFADLVKWSFLFWCGAVAAAMLARV